MEITKNFTTIASHDHWYIKINDIASMFRKRRSYYAEIKPFRMSLHLKRNCYSHYEASSWLNHCVSIMNISIASH